MFGRTLVFDPSEDEAAVARDVDTVVGAGALQKIESPYRAANKSGHKDLKDDNDWFNHSRRKDDMKDDDDDDDDDWFPAEIPGDEVTKAPLCCRMFITEYVHIHQMERLLEAKRARFKSKLKAQGVRRPRRRCGLTRGCAPLLMIVKFLCVGMWVAGIYYGITSIEDLFSEVSTVLDPPEDSRSFQAYVGLAQCLMRAAVFCVFVKQRTHGSTARVCSWAHTARLFWCTCRFANYDTLYQTRDSLKSRFALYVTVTAPSEDMAYSDTMRQFSRVSETACIGWRYVLVCPWLVNEAGHDVCRSYKPNWSAHGANPQSLEQF